MFVYLKVFYTLCYRQRSCLYKKIKKQGEQTMKKRFSAKFTAIIVVVVMLVSVFPMGALAASVDYTPHDSYYKVITKDDYQLAPGVMESEIVLNNASGTHRQVAHVVEVDLDNPYAKVIPSYKGMIPTPGSYGVQIMSEQAKWAENNGYGNVVAAMNLSLSWYNSAYYTEHPELVGEPLGYMVLDGVHYTNSQGKTSGAQTCVVINFDEKDGTVRPTDIPKVEIRSTSDAITGWEEQVIPANFGFLVKNGVNQYSVDNNANNGASRSFVGIKADGTFVMVMNDGRQSPYSAGFTNYEMAEFMLSLGCVQAVNGDGGGSSAFLSQRPGEELKINCSPSDGAERPTTHGILVISTAPATGEFVRASITSENDYYTPGSTVKFSALGTDLVGTAAEIPEDATWQLADSSMGTIENGVFVSNGKTGTATAQMVWNGEVVGESSVEIVIPTAFGFSQAVMTVPFDKEVNITLTATINDGIHNVVLKPEDVSFSTTNSALGTFDGFKFTSVSEENAPADLTSTLTATLVHNTDLVATAALSLGKGSEVLFDFEDEADIDEWNIADVNGNDEGFYQKVSYATPQNGKVHNGVGSMRVEMNPISATGISSGGYGQSDLFLDNGVIVENAISIGFWAYIPDEYEHCWIRVLYWYDSNGDGIFDKKNTISVISQPEVYNTFDESGWRYFSVDVSKYGKILIPGIDSKEIIPYNASKNDANNFRFIEFMFPHTNTNDLWKKYGTINGLQTVYIDNITADFSDAVDDREAPIFSSVSLVGNDTSIALEKYNTVTTTNNLITVSASVAENTKKTNATGLDVSSAKAYVDGVEVDVAYSNGRMTISDVAVANGIHRVKFEICDNMGNKSSVIRLIKVASEVEASTIQVVPADSTLDRLYGGSIYWMNVNATAIETIKSVETVIDLNYGNHWELDHMVLDKGFTAEYSIDEENNTATIVITRTGNNTETGAVTLAALPIRIIYYDTDIKINGFTAEKYWNEYDFWPYDLKVDVDMGSITYVDGYTSNVLGAFSNEEFSVDVEMYTAKAGVDTEFHAQRGTAHVHTPEAMADLASTCTSKGYTNRTYCDVCDSVVDWGTETEVIDHSYKAVNGQLVCDCGETYKETGLVSVDGKAYYMTSSGLAVGWITIGSDWYYFDETTYAAVSTLNNGYVTYEFEADGKLVSGVWYHSSEGSKYFYGPTYYSGSNVGDRWYTIDGKEYCFGKEGYCHKGYNYVRTYDDIFYWYDFGEDGACKGALDYTGIIELNGYIYYVNNGEAKYGLFKYEEDYYFCGASNGYCVVTNITRYCPITYCDMSAGTYTFGVDGKMVNNNIYCENGILYYYVKGQKSKGTGSVELNGQIWTIESNGKVLFTGILTDASGQTLDYKDGVGSKVLKNGIYVDTDGAIRYYVDDVATYAGLVQDSEGNYYYINSSLKAVTNRSYTISAANTNGLLPAGTYSFGADGKMIDPPTDEPVVPEVKNGLVVDEDGAIRYYENGVATYAGLVQDSEGNYYYINSSKKAVTNRSYTISASNANGLLPAGTYNFGSDGKMIDPPTDEPVVPEVKNGLVIDADGAIRYYENGVATYAGLVQDSEGNYYYINSSKQAVTNRSYTISAAKANGLLPAGTYTFGADGKIVF